jgi:hypothetical protein
MKLWKPGDPITAAGLNAMQENTKISARHPKIIKYSLAINTSLIVIRDLYLNRGSSETYLVKKPGVKIYLTTYNFPTSNQPNMPIPVPMNRDIYFPSVNITHTFTEPGEQELCSYNNIDSEKNTIYVNAMNDLP